MDYTVETADIAAREIPPDPTLSDQDHPAAYCPDEGLAAAVNVALILERPLLLTGNPGTGKTQVAYSLAWQLLARNVRDVKSARVAKFETKSTSVSRDLFYSFDVLGRFHASHSNGSLNNVDYITYNALGRALIDSLPRREVDAFLRQKDVHEGPRRSVVLIDEIDKAPRDFPNDLLNEIDQMYFRVPELGSNATIGGEAKGLKPIVVITSNSEKSLPDPFLRRCVYYHIAPPDEARLRDILLARLKRHGAVGDKLIANVVAFAFELERHSLARRKISAPELLQWLVYILRCQGDPSRSLKDNLAIANAGLAAITKDETDQQAVKSALAAFAARL
jgi:MoxR-like ATPase